MEKEIPHAVVLDQYANVCNPLAHYEATAQEIIEDIKLIVPSSSSSPLSARVNNVDQFIDDSSMMSGLPTTTTKPSAVTVEDMEAEKENIDIGSNSSPGKTKSRSRGYTLDKLVDASSRMDGLPTTTNGSHTSNAPAPDEKPSSKPSRPSSGKVDVLVAGAGTGGSISGISKRLKEEWNDTFVVGIDPIGSILAQPESLNALKTGESTFYAVEGIGECVMQIYNTGEQC